MRSLWMWLPVAVLAAMILGPGPGAAADLEQVAADLRPVSGYVVMVQAGGVIIDLDASSGIGPGDLFSVIGAGDKLVHPVTGKVIGNLERQKAVLKVTQVREGYSLARPLGGGEQVSRGDKVRRFTDIPARFWDYAGTGEQVFLELRNRMPWLQWEDYGAAQKKRPKQPGPAVAADPGLLFIYTAGGLEVRDTEFQLLHSYPPFAGRISLGERAARPAAASNPKREAALLRFPEAQALGDLPGLVVSAAFGSFRPRELLAATDGKMIRVYAVAGTLQELASNRWAPGAQVVALEWWQPQAGGALYLAATSWGEQRVQGAILRLDEDGLQPVAEHLPYFLGSQDLDGDGRPETLLRQPLDRDVFWGVPVRQLVLRGNQVKTRDPGFEVPPGFCVLGSVVADLNGDGKLEAAFVRSGVLHIYAGRKELYRSSKQMGGTLASITYEMDPGAKQTETRAAAIEVAPVAVDLNGDGTRELLVVAADTSTFNAPGVTPGVKRSWLGVLRRKDKRFVQGKVGEEMDAHIQGLGMSRGRVLFVVSRPGSTFGAGGSSQVLVYDLR